MTEVPPPPGPGGNVGPSGVGRSGAVTASAVLLIVLGAFAALNGFLIGGGSLNAGQAAGVIAAVLILGLGALQIVSGAKILSLSLRWRRVGLVLTGILSVLTLVYFWIALFTGAPLTFVLLIAVTVALYAYVVLSLTKHRHRFVNP